MDKEEYRIPIYLVEDSLSKMKNTSYQKEEILATLVYNSENAFGTLNKRMISVKFLCWPMKAERALTLSTKVGLFVAMIWMRNQV